MAILQMRASLFIGLVCERPRRSGIDSDGAQIADVLASGGSLAFPGFGDCAGSFCGCVTRGRGLQSSLNLFPIIAALSCRNHSGKGSSHEFTRQPPPILEVDNLSVSFDVKGRRSPPLPALKDVSLGAFETKSLGKW